jgi:hypothetical protein
VRLRSEIVLDRLLITVAAVIALGAGLLSIGSVGEVPTGVALLDLTFVLTIAASETWRVRIPGTGDLAPLAVASSLAFALTTELPGGESTGHFPGLVIFGTAVASLAGQAIYSRMADRPIGLPVVATQVVVVAVAALLFRAVPFDGGTLMARVGAEDGPRWWVALCYFALAGCAIVVQLGVMSLQRSARTGAVLRQAVFEEVWAVGPLAAATTSTAAVVALAVSVLDAFAVPLFLVPLMLLNLAVARQAAVRTAQRQTIFALSRLTELGGYTAPGHAARVADYSVAIGRDLELPERELLDLQAAALLHDLGQVSLRRPIPGGATLFTSPLDQRRVASAGAGILSRTAELSRLSTVVADQATSYRRTEDTGHVALASRILKIANAFDDLVGVDTTPEAALRAVQRMRLSAGDEYDPVVFRSLCRVLRREGRLSGQDYIRLDV